jgi:hypothetical protein
MEVIVGIGIREYGLAAKALQATLVTDTSRYQGKLDGFWE